MQIKVLNDFVGMDMCRKFLEVMIITSQLEDMLIIKILKNMIRNGNIRPQEKD